MTHAELKKWKQYTNLNSIKACRAEMKAEAEKLISAAEASGKRDLQGAELEWFNTILAEINEADREIGRKLGVPDKVPDPPQRPKLMPEGSPALISGTGPITGTDSHGQPFAVFSKEQSVAAFLKQQHGGGEDGVTLGSIVRAMVLGGGSPEIRAALSEGSDSAGGVSVPTVLVGQVIDRLRAKSVAFQAGARVVTLETGKATSIARIATDPAAAWRAENGDVAVSDMTFDAVSFVPKSLAVVVVASDELLEDSLNIDEALNRALAASFAVEVDRVGLIGTGVAPQPKGLSNWGIGSFSMGANGAALADYAPFVEVLSVMQTANAEGPTACIIAPRTARTMALLKDTTNQPLLKPGAISNLPFLVTSSLPVNETQGSANNASRAIMGYFPDLLFGVRHNLRIQILQEAYASKLQRGILADLRVDVAVAHAASFAQVVGIIT